MYFLMVLMPKNVMFLISLFIIVSVLKFHKFHDKFGCQSLHAIGTTSGFDAFSHPVVFNPFAGKRADSPA